MLWRTRVNPVPGRQGPMATRGVAGAPLPPAPPSPQRGGKGGGAGGWLASPVSFPPPRVGEGSGERGTFASAGVRVDGDVDLLVIDDVGHEGHGKGGGAGEGEGFETGVVGGVHGGGEDVAVVVDDPARKL